MNRRTARENAFIAAFELGFGAQSLEELVEYSEECGEYALDDFAQNLLRCYVEHTAQVDEMIRPRLRNACRAPAAPCCAWLLQRCAFPAHRTWTAS